MEQEQVLITADDLINEFQKILDKHTESYFTRIDQHFERIQRSLTGAMYVCFTIAAGLGVAALNTGCDTQVTQPEPVDVGYHTAPDIANILNV